MANLLKMPGIRAFTPLTLTGQRSKERADEDDTS